LLYEVLTTSETPNEAAMTGGISADLGVAAEGHSIRRVKTIAQRQNSGIFAQDSSQYEEGRQISSKTEAEIVDKRGEVSID